MYTYIQLRMDYLGSSSHNLSEQLTQILLQASKRQMLASHHTPICAGARARTYMSIYIYEYIYAYLYAMHVHMYANMHIYVHLHIYIYIYMYSNMHQDV